MSYPSLSFILSGAGITAILFATNWLVWRLSEARYFRFGPSAVVAAGPADPEPSLHDLNDSGFKHVA